MLTLPLVLLAEHQDIPAPSVKTLFVKQKVEAKGRTRSFVMAPAVHGCIVTARVSPERVLKPWQTLKRSFYALRVNVKAKKKP